MAVEFQEKVRQEIPQIVPETGMSANYESEYQALLSGLLDKNLWNTFMVPKLKEKLAAGENDIVAYYAQRFQPVIYDHSKMLSEDMKKKVADIDSIADQINTLYRQGDYNRKKFAQLMLQGCRIIFGDESKDYLGRLKDLEDEFGEDVVIQKEKTNS